MNHLNKVAAAREALARVAPYRPEVEPYYRGGPSVVWEQAREIIALLRVGPAGSRGDWWWSSRSENGRRTRSPKGLPPGRAEHGGRQAAARSARGGRA